MYDLDVSNNINCFEIYRNGTSLSSVLSLFLPLTDGILTGNSTGTTISATELTGSGPHISNLDYNNIVYNKPDLNIYAIKSNVDLSLNSLNTNKQNNLTFNNPFLNSSNSISLKYNSAQLVVVIYLF